MDTLNQIITTIDKNKREIILSHMDNAKKAFEKEQGKREYILNKNKFSLDQYVEAIQKEIEYCNDMLNNINNSIGLIDNTLLDKVKYLININLDNLKNELQIVLAQKIVNELELDSSEDNKILDNKILEISFYRSKYKICVTVINKKTDRDIFTEMDRCWNKKTKIESVERLSDRLIINGMVFMKKDISIVGLVDWDESKDKGISYIKKECPGDIETYGYKDAWKYISEEIWNEYFIYSKYWNKEELRYTSTVENYRISHDYEPYNIKFRKLDEERRQSHITEIAERLRNMSPAEERRMRWAQDRERRQDCIDGMIEEYFGDGRELCPNF